jgi:arylsulfatase A-like enzyme
MAKAFTPTPVCSPARASFFTGRLPSQHGLHDYLLETEGEARDHEWMEHETTIAPILSDAGYQTALVGKWHCGQGERTQPGFDYWFSLGPRQGGHRGPHTYWHNGQPVDLTGYKSSITTDHAIDFLRTRDADKPFFMFVGYIATHSPWSDHPERLVKQYDTATFHDIPSDTTYPFGRLAGEGNLASRNRAREAQAQYYASVSEVDEQVGRIVDQLDALGIREDTLVIYVADHGLNCGHHGLWGKGNATRPLNMLEESIRIPLIFNGAGLPFPGRVRSEFVDHCDLFLTLLDFAGVSLAPEMVKARCYPGRSFKTVLQGGALPDWKTHIFGEYGNLRMVRTRTHKLVCRYPDGPNELFDLVADPRETINLFDHPEAFSLVQELTAEIETFFTRYEDSEKTGLRVRELPMHNRVEAWREAQLTL